MSSGRPVGEDNWPAELLQRLPHRCRWALADGALLLSIARNLPVNRGVRGGRLLALFRWAGLLGIERLTLLAVGLLEATRLFMRQGREVPGRDVEARLFIGFGAGAEESLLQGYQSAGRGPARRLNQCDVESFGRVRRVGWIAIAKCLVETSRAAMEGIVALPVELASWRSEFLTSAGARIGLYSYMKTWFETTRVSPAPPSEACFLTADTPAFAAVEAGLTTRYLQHGLIRHSLVWPQFTRIDALTPDEETHLRRRVPTAEVRSSRAPAATGSPGTGVLIASVYESPSEMEKVSPIVEWFLQRGVQVSVRPHPREERAFWVASAGRWPCTIDDSDPSFAAALERLRPRFVVSWYSTALAEALQHGIVPVTVSAAQNPDVRDLVYRLHQRALRWPEDMDRLDGLLTDDEAYARTLRSLRDTVPFAGSTGGGTSAQEAEP